MARKMEAFLDRAERCDTFEDLYTLVCDLRGLFQVEHVVYHSVNHEGEPFALATYPVGWANYYESEQLYRLDPVVLNAFQRFHPYSWKSLSWENKTQQQFLRDAIDGGVGNQGLSVPIRGPHGEFALFSVSHTATDLEWAAFCDRNRSDMLLMGHFLHQAARRIMGVDHSAARVNLSPRETDALALLGAGLNRGRAAEKLAISEHTLRVYIESARFKLGASNTTHAVAKAMSRGLISL